MPAVSQLLTFLLLKMSPTLNINLLQTVKKKEKKVKMASTCKSHTTLSSKRSIQQQYGRLFCRFLGVNYDFYLFIYFWSIWLSSCFKTGHFALKRGCLRKLSRSTGIQQHVKSAPPKRLKRVEEPGGGTVLDGAEFSDDGERKQKRRQFSMSAPLV